MQFLWHRFVYFWERPSNQAQASPQPINVLQFNSASVTSALALVAPVRIAKKARRRIASHQFPPELCGIPRARGIEPAREVLLSGGARLEGIARVRHIGRGTLMTEQRLQIPRVRGFESPVEMLMILTAGCEVIGHAVRRLPQIMHIPVEALPKATIEVPGGLILGRGRGCVAARSGTGVARSGICAALCMT